MSKKKTNPVQEAVKIVGGKRKAAEICGVSTQAVYKWLEAGQVSLVKYAYPLAEASGIDIKRLGGVEEVSR